MIELVAIIVVTVLTGKLAISKGLKPFKWRMFSVLFWVLGELVGLLIGFATIGTPKDLSDIYSYLPFAYGGAITAHLLFYNYLKRLPDANNDDEIEGIGVDDLYPKK